MAIKLVIFDLDGTITQPYFDFDAIRREMGLARDSGPILEILNGLPAEEKARLEKILEYHEQRAALDSELNPGTKKTLAELRKTGILQGILTRNSRKNTDCVTKIHKLRFDYTITREDGPVKPHPFGVHKLCRELRTPPEETLLVGDYLFDIQSANAAGATSVLLKTHKKSEEFAKYADFID